MGGAGVFIGIMFFLMVAFAAITSSVSIMEAIVSGLMDKWKLSRRKSSILVTIYSVVAGIIVCLGYNVFYFELKLPNGTTGQLLDLMDYVSNSVLMPIVALLTCILIGWVVKPETVIGEVEKSGKPFRRKVLYIIMVRFVAPILLFILLIQSF